MNIYFIFSSKRSGTHLISNIIMNSYDISLYKNDCLYKNDSSDDITRCLYKGEYEFKKYTRNIGKNYIGTKDIRKIGNIREYNCIVFSAEEFSLKYFIERLYQSFIAKLENVLGKFNLYIVQNVRDPRNILASCLKIGWYDDIIRKVLNNQHESLINYNIPNTYLCIYDKIILDKTYLSELSSKLKLNNQKSIESLNYVDSFGGGSSFNSITRVDICKYLERYKSFENTERYRLLLDTKHLELYVKIYNAK